MPCDRSGCFPSLPVSARVRCVCQREKERERECESVCVYMFECVFMCECVYMCESVYVCVCVWPGRMSQTSRDYRSQTCRNSLLTTHTHRQPRRTHVSLAT